MHEYDAFMANIARLPLRSNLSLPAMNMALLPKSDQRRREVMIVLRSRRTTQLNIVDLVQHSPTPTLFPKAVIH